MKKRVAKIFYWIAKKLYDDFDSPFEARLKIIHEKYNIKEITSTMQINRLINEYTESDFINMLYRQMQDDIMKYWSIIDTEMHDGSIYKTAILEIAERIKP